MVRSIWLRIVPGMLGGLLVGVLMGDWLPEGQARLSMAEDVWQTTEVAEYAAGELLVKFSAEASQAVERARREGTLPRVDVESLDRLFARYEVVGLERMYPQAHDLEAIKAKFPERARRAPADAKSPSLAHVYKLNLLPDVDIREAASAVEADPHVEYAHPNYIVTTTVPSEEANR